MLFYATINTAVGLAILTFTQKQQITRLLDSVVVLRPTRHKRVISETFPQASALAWQGKKINPTQQKQAFTSQKKCTKTQNKHKKLKPGLVAFCDIRPGNGAGLFSKE